MWDAKYLKDKFPGIDWANLNTLREKKPGRPGWTRRWTSCERYESGAFKGIYLGRRTSSKPYGKLGVSKGSPIASEPSLKVWTMVIGSTTVSVELWSSNRSVWIWWGKG